MESYKENDKYLPIANIGRIMKKPLHENAKIAKEAKEIVQICVSEFISFVTSEACEKCNNEKRKTITGEDILYAIKELGFSNYLDILKVYLHKYRNSNKNQMMITDRQNYESQIFHEQLDYQSIFHNNKNNFNNHFQNLDLKYDSQYFPQHNSKNFNDQLRIKNNENVDFNIQSNNQSNQFINNIDNESSVHYFKKQDEIIFHDDSDFPLSRNSFFQ